MHIWKKIASSMLIVLLTSTVVFAHNHSQVTIENAYIKETIPGTNISSAYMLLHNDSQKNLRLINASSNVSERIEIHEHIMQDDIMKMRQREYVEITAKNYVQFQPSGYHLMLFNLKKPLKSGETVIITLHFDNQTDIDVNYVVKGLKRKMHHHH